jgi:hypothetical protein
MLRLIVIAMCWLLAIVSSADPAMASNDFQYSAELIGPIEKNTHYQVILPDEVLTKCSRNCGDLRLSGPDNSEIPYVILKNISHEKIEKYDLEVISYDYDDDSGLTVIILKLPPKYKPISIIYLNTAERDFKRDLLLYGSHEMENWQLIKEDTIYDFSSQVNLRKTEIQFSPADYRFYMIKILKEQLADEITEDMRLQYNDLQFSVNNIKKDSRISVNRFIGQTSLGENKTAVYDEIELREFDSSIEGEKDTVITFEAPLQFDRVVFDITNPYYYRQVEIYGSDSGKEDSFRLLSRDSLYRFNISRDEETKDYITCASGKYKFYKLIINNKDNPPLGLQTIKLKWLQKILYFIGLHDSPSYSLHFGNPLLKLPEYDLSRFIRQDNWNINSSKPLRISPILKNQDYQPAKSPVGREKIEKIVLTLIVILMTAGISFWLYMLLRKTSRREEG